MIIFHDSIVTVWYGLLRSLLRSLVLVWVPSNRRRAGDYTSRRLLGTATKWPATIRRRL